MAAYRLVYDSRHLQADCQEPGSAPLYPTRGNRVWATFTFYLYCTNVTDYNRKRKCADTIGTVLVPWAGHFHPVLNINVFFQIKYTEAILSNSARKPLWFEITKMLIAV